MITDFGTRSIGYHSVNLPSAYKDLLKNSRPGQRRNTRDAIARSLIICGLTGSALLLVLLWFGLFIEWKLAVNICLLSLAFVVSGLITVVSGQGRRDYSVRFSGALTDEARDQLRAAKEMFGEKAVFFLTEAGDWKRVPFRDPLIVGSDGERLWLVGKFNPTTLEELIANEYAVKAES